MIFKNFKEIDLEGLKLNKEITILKFSDFGFPICIKLKLEDVFLKNYAQYNDCLQIQGKLPRKRKSSAYLIKPYENFIIYNGFVDIIDYTDKSIEGSVTITKLGMCFDDMWINETQPVQYLIDCVKDDMKSGRNYNSIKYDTDDYYRRYVDINEIIVKDGYLEFN